MKIETLGKKVRRIIAAYMLIALNSAQAADFPLYVEFIPFAAPDLYLQEARVPGALYVNAMNAGVTYNFLLTPALAAPLSLAEGLIPISLAVYRVPADCSGNKSVTVSVDYNIGGVYVNIGSQTQNINVPAAGGIVPVFNFNGITSANSHVFDVGDFVRLSITANTTRLCLVNEFPTGGVDTDASRLVLQTGPIISVSKTVSTVSDPVNGMTNPKAIPGAVMRYTVTLSNDPDASAPGEDVMLSDPIPTDATYMFGDNNITLDGIGQTDASDADATDFGVTTPNTVTSDLGTVNPGDSHILIFDVTID